MANSCVGDRYSPVVSGGGAERPLNLDLAVGGNFCADDNDGCASPLAYGRIGLHAFLGRVATLGVDLDMGGLSRELTSTVSLGYWSLRLYLVVRGQFELGRAEFSVGLGLGYMHEENESGSIRTGGLMFEVEGASGNGMALKVPLSLGYRVSDGFSLGAEFTPHMIPVIERCSTVQGTELCSTDNGSPLFNLQLGIFARFHL